MRRPRCPFALWIPADRTNFHPRHDGLRAIDLIVPHITDGQPSAIETAHRWQRPGLKSSAHFAIGQDGRIVQAVDLDDVAWHAHAANSRSVGIEHCARTKGELGAHDPGLPMSPAQYEASARLARWLSEVLPLPLDRDHVKGHADVDHATTHADCPTGALDWETWWAAVVALQAQGLG